MLQLLLLLLPLTASLAADFNHTWNQSTCWREGLPVLLSVQALLQITDIPQFPSAPLSFSQLPSAALRDDTGAVLPSPACNQRHGGDDERLWFTWFTCLCRSPTCVAAAQVWVTQL